MSIRIECKVMDHARGVWPGIRPQWWTATDEETGLSVTWHDHCEVAQYRARDTALTCLQLMIDEIHPAPLPGGPSHP